MRFRTTAMFATFLLITGGVTSWVVAQDSPAAADRAESTADQAAETPSTGAVSTQAPPTKADKKDQQPKIRHVVLLEFNDDAPAEKIAEIEQAFAALPTKIKEIADLEWGLNNSPEGLNNGFSHCFLVTFNSDADRQVYLPHPAHKEFANLLRPHLKEVLVVDYSPKPMPKVEKQEETDAE